MVGGGFEGVLVVDTVAEGVKAKERLSFTSPYSFHSSISGRSATIIPILTNPGNFLFPALRPHSIRAFSSVATSRAWNEILFAFRIVSNREVAVTICEEPEERDV